MSLSSLVRFCGEHLTIPLPAMRRSTRRGPAGPGRGGREGPSVSPGPQVLHVLRRVVGPGLARVRREHEHGRPRITRWIKRHGHGQQ
jgi:hypothetical protein